jgi:hypothetical protein
MKVTYKLVKVSYTRFQQNICETVMGYMASQFMALHKVGFVMNQHRCKSNFHDEVFHIGKFSVVWEIILCK